MKWKKDDAYKRIQDLITQFPATLSEDMLLKSHRALNEQDFSDRKMAIELGEPSRFLKGLSHDESRIVDGVHIYAKLLDYDDAQLESGRETEQSHKRLLAFLNLHYATADRVIQDLGAIRVDYHGGRLHAVIVEPFGNERERLLEAMRLCNLLEEVATEAVEKYGEKGMGARLRFGIDSGKCVAIGNASIKLEGIGRKENDPLFLGSAANESAKLVEKDDAEGIFLTPRAGQVLNDYFVSSEKSIAFNDDTSSVRSNAIFERWDAEITMRQFEKRSPADFNFHHHAPPLSSIQFAKLSASNSIRMDVCSIFADLDGYTAYVDDCIARGAIREAVRNIQVIRSELGLVLKQDFGGKKVRFIGDCIHGILASGDEQNVNYDDTVKDALLCSGGMRSSFDICQELLPDTQKLGLAIGIEYGVTPISRIGIQGGQSVRVASAKVVAVSEEEQKRCSGTETAVGHKVYDELKPNIKRYFGDERKARGLDYRVLLLIGLAPLASPSIASGSDNEDSTADNDSSPSVESPAAPPFRPHTKS